MTKTVKIGTDLLVWHKWDVPGRSLKLQVFRTPPTKEWRAGWCELGDDYVRIIYG